MKSLVAAVVVVVGASILSYWLTLSGDGAVRTTPDIWVPAASQRVPAGPLRAGHIVSQDFVAERDRLCAVEFLGATYGIPIYSGTIRVTIARSEAPNPGIVAVREIDAPSVANNGYVRIDFPPVRESAGHRFSIAIEPRDVPPSAMFTVWLTQNDMYPNGTASIDGTKAPGDLVMTVSHQSSVFETAAGYFTVFSVSVLIGVYFLLIGLAALLMFKAEVSSLLFTAPAVGMGIVAAVAAIGVLAHRSHSINLAGAIVLVCFTMAILYKNRERLLRLRIPRLTIFLYLTLVAVSCSITSQPQTIPHSDLPDGPWRSFVPMYPADGLIPYESASIIANGLKPDSFLFEPRWSIADRTHLMTLLYLHVCQFFGIVPAHVPQGPWEIVDRYGFWLLRSLAFATNAFVLFGMAAVGSLILDRSGVAIASALAVLSPFVVFNALYSWPKFLCAYLILIGIYLLIRGKPAWAGGLFGLAYWAHPMANLFCLGGCVYAWMLGRDRWSSARSVAGFACMVALGVGTTMAFSHGALHASGASFYLYPLATEYHFHPARDAAVVLRDFRATPVADLLAIRLENLIRFVFPTDIARSPVQLRPGQIWETAKWDWLEMYQGSLWCAAGLLLFPLGVFGVYASRQQRERWGIAFAFVAVPAMAYVVWMGFIHEHSGNTTCQPMAVIAVMFAAIALQSCRRPAAMAIATAVALEMLFALSIPYRDGISTFVLTGMCLAAIWIIWVAVRPADAMTTPGSQSIEVAATAAATSETRLTAGAPMPAREKRPRRGH